MTSLVYAGRFLFYSSLVCFLLFHRQPQIIRPLLLEAGHENFTDILWTRSLQGTVVTIQDMSHQDPADCGDGWDCFLDESDRRFLQAGDDSFIHALPSIPSPAPSSEVNSISRPDSSSPSPSPYSFNSSKPTSPNNATPGISPSPELGVSSPAPTSSESMAPVLSSPAPSSSPSLSPLPSPGPAPASVVPSPGVVVPPISSPMSSPAPSPLSTSPSLSPSPGLSPTISPSPLAPTTISPAPETNTTSPEIAPGPAREGAPPPQTGSPSPLTPQPEAPSGPPRQAPNSAPSPSASPLQAPNTAPAPAGCCTSGMMPRPLYTGTNCSCVYPIEVGLLLNNATIVANWSQTFESEFASQLNLSDAQVMINGVQFVKGNSELNLTIDIGPLVGDSFSTQDVKRIEAALENHQVVLSSALFGNYTLQYISLFGPPAPPLSAGSPPPSSHVEGSKGGKSISLPLIIGVAAGSLVLLILVVVVVYKICTLRKPEKTSPQASGKSSTFTGSSFSEVPSIIDVHPSSTRQFSYEELKEATHSFDPAQLLGEGGFGRVYRGLLKDGTEVAIKKLTSGGHQGDREFLVEVEMLSRLHHRHLVKLVGYFTSRDALTQLLCYELVPNGSLESWLHGHLGQQRPLDWNKRMKIAIGAARGLAYLHEDSQPCVIHRDFKASNILLEHNFTAKVADFGLAKQAPEGQSNYVSTRVMGTFGYVAPEYAMTGHLLVKSDVYSYGVVLLELLSGRKPVDMSQPSGQENLVSWARPLLKDKDRLGELADLRMGGRYPKEDFAQVAAIAAACVAPEANQRPTMGEVVQSLKLVQGSTSDLDRDNQVDTPSASNRSFTVSWQNTRPTSTTFESDGSSSIFSSGPISGLVGLESDNLSRTTVISEDLQEGR